MVESFCRSMVTVLLEKRVVSESYISPIAKPPGVWLGNLPYHVVGSKHHQDDMSNLPYVCSAQFPWFP